MNNMRNLIMVSLFVVILFPFVQTAKGQIAFQEIPSNVSGFPCVGESWEMPSGYQKKRTV